MATMAICLDARERRDYARAIEMLEIDAGLTWAQGGQAVLRDDVLRLPSAEIGLAGLLLQTGDLDRAHSLLEGVLARLDYALNKTGRGLAWDVYRVEALALLGNTDAALTALEARAAHGFGLRGWVYEIAPALDSLRSDPRFRRLAEKAREQAAAERAKIERMRAAGRLPSLAPG